MELRIRKARAGDAQAIAELSYRSLRHFAPDTVLPTPQPGFTNELDMLKFVAENVIANANSTTLVAHGPSGKIVGTTSFGEGIEKGFKGKQFWLSFIAAEPGSFAGKRFLKDAMNAAARKGYQQLHLLVMEKDAKAMRTWKAVGASKVGENEGGFGVYRIPTASQPWGAQSPRDWKGLRGRSQR